MKTSLFRSQFVGLGALLHSRRGLIKAGFWLSLVFGLALAFAFRSGYVDEELRKVLGFVLMIGLAAVSPLAMAGEDTFRETPGGRSFREGLLAGPIGSLAIPAMVHLGSLALIGAVLLGSLPGLAVILGSHPGAPIPDLSTAFVPSLLFFVSLWACFSCIASIGNNPAAGLTLLAVVPLLWIMAPLGAGYSEQAHAKIVVFWSVLMLVLIGGLSLALPYLLYRRPRHHWAEKMTLTTVSTHEGSIWLVTLGLCVTPFAGLGWGLLFLVPGVGLVEWGRRQRLPNRRYSLGHFEYGALVILAPFLPLFALGLIGDAYFVQQAATYDPNRHRHGQDAPSGGRRVVLLARSVAGIAGVSSRARDQLYALDGLGRTVVLDSEGAVEFVFPQRFGVIDPNAWSSDGRYLAVHDQTIGNLQVGLPDRVERARRSSRDVFDRLQRHYRQRVQGTYVLDTQTGELTRLPLVELRPGWSEPGQLVRHTLGLAGQHVFAEVGGRAAETNLKARVRRYTPAGAIVSTPDGLHLLGASGLEPLRD